MIKPLAEGRPRKLNYLITTAVKQSQEWGALSAPLQRALLCVLGWRRALAPSSSPLRPQPFTAHTREPPSPLAPFAVSSLIGNF